MTLLDALAELPDDAAVTVTVRVSELRAALNTRNPRRLLTTGQAAAELGYSPDTWRTWAETDRIEGAFRDEGSEGTWRLPLGACEEHLEHLRASSLNRRRKRAPWKKASAASARGARTADHLEGPVGVLRLEAVGRRETNDAESGSTWVAGSRGENSRSGGGR